MKIETGHHGDRVFHRCCECGELQEVKEFDLFNQFTCIKCFAMNVTAWLPGMEIKL